jgi:hypothetical protein
MSALVTLMNVYEDRGPYGTHFDRLFAKEAPSRAPRDCQAQLLSTGQVWTFERLGEDSRKGPDGKLPSRNSYPVDFRKTELRVESQKGLANMAFRKSMLRSVEKLGSVGNSV